MLSLGDVAHQASSFWSGRTSRLSRVAETSEFQSLLAQLEARFLPFLCRGHLPDNVVSRNSMVVQALVGYSRNALERAFQFVRQTPSSRLWLAARSVASTNSSNVPFGRWKTRTGGASAAAPR